MKKMTVVILTAALAAAIMTGCSGNSDNSPSNTSTESTTSSNSSTSFKSPAYTNTLRKRSRNSSASAIVRHKGGSRRITLVPLTPVNTFCSNSKR